jgi:hypothetical protein
MKLSYQDVSNFMNYVVGTPPDLMEAMRGGIPEVASFYAENPDKVPAIRHDFVAVAVRSLCLSRPQSKFIQVVTGADLSLSQVALNAAVDCLADIQRLHQAASALDGTPWALHLSGHQDDRPSPEDNRLQNVNFIEGATYETIHLIVKNRPELADASLLKKITNAAIGTLDKGCASHLGATRSEMLCALGEIMLGESVQAKDVLPVINRILLPILEPRHIRNHSRGVDHRDHQQAVALDVCCKLVSKYPDLMPPVFTAVHQIALAAGWQEHNDSRPQAVVRFLGAAVLSGTLSKSDAESGINRIGEIASVKMYNDASDECRNALQEIQLHRPDLSDVLFPQVCKAVDIIGYGKNDLLDLLSKELSNPEKSSSRIPMVVDLFSRLFSEGRNYHEKVNVGYKFGRLFIKGSREDAWWGIDPEAADRLKNGLANYPEGERVLPLLRSYVRFSKKTLPELATLLDVLASIVHRQPGLNEDVLKFADIIRPFEQDTAAFQAMMKERFLSINSPAGGEAVPPPAPLIPRGRRKKAPAPSK